MPDFLEKSRESSVFRSFSKFSKRAARKKGAAIYWKREVMSVCRKKNEKFGLFIIGLAVGILLSVVIPDTVVIFLLAGLCLVVGILLMR